MSKDLQAINTSVAAARNDDERRASVVASIAETEDSYPSRCESPLLPMGHHTASYKTDPDRLSQQLGRHGHRQSQHSVMYKNYDLRDDNIDQPVGPVPQGRSNTGATKTPGRYQMRRPRTLRAKTYRMAGSSDNGPVSPVRELSSKFKSACRKLNPKRLTTKSTGQRNTTGDLADKGPMDMNTDFQAALNNR
ncbi:hypothetical protein GGI07_002651 [Coemansia sp. Benny D115]|nr:hypothetical protein GGI07_002651 [Coemansia sp. Benny D115]